MNKYFQSEGEKNEKALYPPPYKFCSLALALIASLVFFSCGNLQGSNSADIAIHIPTEQITNTSFARAVVWSEDPAVYGVEVRLYVNGKPRTQNAQGTLLELSQKTFVFEQVPLGNHVKAQANVYKDGDVFWSGESQAITIAADENNLNIKMIKQDLLLLNKKINGVKLLKTSEVVVLPKGKSLTINGTESSGMFRTGRTVTLTRAFAMGQYQVTQELFEAVMGVNPSSFNGSSGKEPASGEIQRLRPVEQVSWYDTIAFCNKLSILCGLEPCYSVSGITDWESLSYSDIPDSEDTNWNAPVCDWTKNGYRLPTGTEWEFAARGGNPDATAWGYTYAGGNDFENLVWSGDNSGNKTHEVGLKKGNTLGLYDMSGNVNERCWDVWASGVIETGTFTDPTGATTGNRRLWRGGGWSGAAASYCKLSYIATCSWDLSSRLSSVGIRLCRTITSD